MKQIKYILSIFLSVFLMIFPLLGIFAFYIDFLKPFAAISFVFSLFISYITFKPMHKLRNHLRDQAEYDEFGRSKKKGKYENLSRSEREQIDLQKTADMERILDTSMIKKISKIGSINPEKDMENLIGLQPVKEKMEELVARMQFDSKQKKKINNENNISCRHMIFYGNPGTGKTTVARILTGFLYKYKYIKKNKCVEVDGNMLKAGSDTATKTTLLIREAFDGVLFIDEAYSLMTGLDGDTAIATLIKQMEDNRGRFIVILAGYTKEMQELLNSNPGFESRIKEYFLFDDYNNNEIKEIFSFMAKQQNFNISEDAFPVLLERIEKEKKLKSFGNARTVRNVLEESIDKHALNYKKEIIPKECQFMICKEDIPKELKRNRF